MCLPPDSSTPRAEDFFPATTLDPGDNVKCKSTSTVLPSFQQAKGTMDQANFLILYDRIPKRLDHINELARLKDMPFPQRSLAPLQGDINASRDPQTVHSASERAYCPPQEKVNWRDGCELANLHRNREINLRDLALHSHMETVSAFRRQS